MSGGGGNSGYQAQIPQAPNYAPIAEASQKAAELQAQTSTDQLNWAKQQYADQQPQTQQVESNLIGALDTNQANAEADRARYQQVYQPFENQQITQASRDRSNYETNYQPVEQQQIGNAEADRKFATGTYQPLETRQAQTAASYDSPDRRAMLRGEAEAGVAQSFDAAGDNAQRTLEGYGVKPSDTRAAALDVGVKVQRAAAQAAAGTTSDRAVENTGIGLVNNAVGVGANLQGMANGEMTNVVGAGLTQEDRANAEATNITNTGRGYPGQVAQAYGTGTSAGVGGVGVGNQTTSAFAPSLGNGAAYAGLSNNSIGNWSNALTSGYNAALGSYNAGAATYGMNAQINQNQSSGVGSVLGTLAGIGGSIASKAIFAAKGGVIPGAPTGTSGGMPGVIPRAASPSLGAVQDDVTAKVTPGEMVIPRDAVSWFGEKYFQKQIQKSREERSGAPAKPQVKQTGGVPSPVTYLSPGAAAARGGPPQGVARGVPPHMMPTRPQGGVPMRVGVR